jgi:hypothetical protein
MPKASVTPLRPARTSAHDQDDLVLTIWRAQSIVKLALRAAAESDDHSLDIFNALSVSDELLEKAGNEVEAKWPAVLP